MYCCKPRRSPDKISQSKLFSKSGCNTDSGGSRCVFNVNKHKDAQREMLAKVVQTALIRPLNDPFKSQTPQISKLN